MRLAGLNALAVCALFLSSSALQAQAVATTDKPAYESDPKFIAAMTEAKHLAAQHSYVFAMDEYKKANKAAGGVCVRCLQQIEAIQMGLGSFKDAIATAKQVLALASTPRDKSMAEGELGTALLGQFGDKPKPEQLAQAHAVFESAVADFAGNNSARWEDACTLARMGKLDEAKEQFSACAEKASRTDPMRVRAQHFAENPELSLHKMAPAFEVTALDGTKFNLDNMGGKVVLIDFWATWCGPCNEELPTVKKIAKEFAGQAFVLISVSWDDDDKKWKDFVAKNEMTWLQYRDNDHKLAERFGIHEIPHYFTIDSDGVLTAEVIGGGSDVEGKIKKLIKRAQAAQGASAVASAGTN
jgi:thiol-disulfide isomerase/thioredoxin